MNVCSACQQMKNKLEEKEKENKNLKFELKTMQEKKENVEKEMSGIRYQNQILLEEEKQNEIEYKNHVDKIKIQNEKEKKYFVHKIFTNLKSSTQENVKLRVENKDLQAKLSELDCVEDFKFVKIL
jgi:regulator of replication initiation timing